MSWRDRATVITDETKNESWKSRAVPVEPRQENGPSVEGFIDNLTANAGRIAKGGVSIVRGASKMPMEHVQSISEMGLGVPFSETPTAERYRTIGRGVIEGVKSIPGAYANLVKPKEWYQSPLDQAINAASIAVPFLKGSKVSSLAKEAAKRTAIDEGVSVPEKIFAASTQIATGTPSEAVIARLKNPAAVKTAFSHAELADQMVTSVKNFGDTLSESANKAAIKLRSSPYIEEGAIPKTDILDVVKSARRKLGGTYTKETQSAAKTLKDIAQNFQKKMKSTVSEAQIKERIQELDGNINWSDPSASSTNKALIFVRTRLDKILKDQNPSYREAMVPVDEGTRVLNKMQDTFGIKHETARGFYASDQTANRIKMALKENKLDTQSVISRFEKISGEDLTTKMKNANARLAFETPGKSFGSTRSNVGAILGAAGGLPGAVIGTISGAIANVYGPQVAGAVIDTLANPNMAKYAAVMQKAAVQGPARVAAVHVALLENDPTYAAAIRANKRLTTK